MYYFLSFLSAACIAVMIVLNGRLTDAYGVFSAGVIIHLTGFAAISLSMLVKRERMLRPALSCLLYTGGLIGVATTLLNNLTFGKISVSSILALSLLSQSILSIVLEHWGLLGTPRKRLSVGRIWGLSFTVLGILVLLWGNAFSPVPVFLSLLAGITIISSRLVNASLAQKTSIRYSTWCNYLTGLVLSLILWFFSFREQPGIFSTPPGHILIYTGGIIGVVVVMLFSLCTLKLPAFPMTLTLFIGQIFTGVLLDIILEGSFSLQHLSGGILTALGLCLNFILEETNPRKNL